MRHLPPLLFLFIALQVVAQGQTQFFPASHKLIRYTGRGDFKNPENPRFYQPGTYMEARFSGPACNIIIRDQQLWGDNQNYLQVVVDGQDFRTKTKGPLDTIVVTAQGSGPHHLLVCKNTEANVGWIEFGGLICEKLVELPPPPPHKIEFIGNSITCAAGADASSIPCGTGKWHDQHNAWHGYGPVTARALNAQWHLNAVSGIGLIRSCCDLEITMPIVYDKTDMRGDSLEWDFSGFTPDLVTVCLGQNDGIQDSTAFCSAYVRFVRDLRGHYPEAEIILLTSPMGNAELTATLKNYLASVVRFLKANGDGKVDWYAFKKQYIGGCDAHPNLEEHKEMAGELTQYIRQKMNW